MLEGGGVSTILFRWETRMAVQHRDTEMVTVLISELGLVSNSNGSSSSNSNNKGNINKVSNKHKNEVNFRGAMLLNWLAWQLAFVPS